ncbi:MAG: hypothetical protein HYV63_29170 [Candidatus Schekmanbacteria bacterium]|nr:hypothetical protein [Candidatus Schekmanbacteria bacterium]
MQNSSSHITFKDGTSSAASQPVVETTAPSNSLSSIMANWLIAVAEPARVDATPSQKESQPAKLDTV